jgi:hypothetical protein
MGMVMQRGGHLVAQRIRHAGIIRAGDQGRQCLRQPRARSLPTEDLPEQPTAYPGRRICFRIRRPGQHRRAVSPDRRHQERHSLLPQRHHALPANPADARIRTIRHQPGVSDLLPVRRSGWGAA